MAGRGTGKRANPTVGGGYTLTTSLKEKQVI